MVGSGSWTSLKPKPQQNLSYFFLNWPQLPRSCQLSDVVKSVFTGGDWRAQVSLSLCLYHTLSPLFFQLPVCFLSQTVHSTSMTQLWKQVDRGTLTRSIDNTYFLSVVSRRRKSEPPWALILEPQMAGGGLRGLDFIKELTLIIVNCKKRGGFHCLCNLCTMYTHTN